MSWDPVRWKTLFCIPNRWDTLCGKLRQAVPVVLASGYGISVFSASTRDRVACPSVWAEFPPEGRQTQCEATKRAARRKRLHARKKADKQFNNSTSINMKTIENIALIIAATLVTGFTGCIKKRMWYGYRRSQCNRRIPLFKNRNKNTKMTALGNNVGCECVFCTG